ncbi:MAG: 1-acyl-sn-glycerol-3-phosphate acyltransferase [Defluviitaleaceae bacterium]|nr:1-acyl-sn-glycerol-3-phosphate acyltransferase [Defluviitaleaceae bacterium]
MFYFAAKHFMRFWLRLLYRVRVEGVENVPDGGAFIICSNHIHSMDPAMFAICLRRRIYFMAKKELFKYGFFGFFLDKLGAFPVDRGVSDMKAYKKAIGYLEDGGGLLVFSQGTRTAGFENAKNGAALFALKTGAALIPAGIACAGKNGGAYRFFKKVTIKIGEPIDMQAYEGKKINTRLVEELMGETLTAVKGYCG